MTFIDLDVAIFRGLNIWAGKSFFWDWVIIFHAVYAWRIIVAAAAAFAAAALLPRFHPWRRANIHLLILAAVSALFSRFVITESIRFFFNRQRPFEVLPDVSQLIPHAGGGSFPSGHAALAFAVAAAAFFYYPKTSVLFFFAALSIGISRVAAGVHWPSDILAGAAVGIFSAWAVHRILRRQILSTHR